MALLALWHQVGHHASNPLVQTGPWSELLLRAQMQTVTEALVLSMLAPSWVATLGNIRIAIRDPIEVHQCLHTSVVCQHWPNLGRNEILAERTISLIIDVDLDVVRQWNKP